MKDSSVQLPFAFTSMGAYIDRSSNMSRGPPIFRINGQIHHRIGSLLPTPGHPPKFAELYIYDTDNKVANRICALHLDDNIERYLDPDIVAGLINMLDEFNHLLQQFRIARDRLIGYENEHVAIRIVGPVDGDGPQLDLPIVDQLAALLVTDFSIQTSSRDIVVHDMSCGLCQISSLHPAFMALQYRLLFPRGDRGFQLGVLYSGLDLSHLNTRAKMAIQDYYRYFCHYRKNEYNPYLCCGMLSAQIKSGC